MSESRSTRAVDGGHGQAGALEQAQGHVLVAAQAQAQGGGAGHGVAEHADEGGHAHLVEGAVDDVVVLVEDDVGPEAVELALEDGQVAGERQDDDLVAEAPEAAGDAADHLAEVMDAPRVGLLVGLGIRVGVVDERDTELLHAPADDPLPLILEYFRGSVQARRARRAHPESGDAQKKGPDLPRPAFATGKEDPAPMIRLVFVGEGEDGQEAVLADLGDELAADLLRRCRSAGGNRPSWPPCSRRRGP